MGADIKKGDRVRVTIEGVVDAAHNLGKFRVSVGNDEGHDEGGSFAWVHPETATIEKIEPPVEVFKPGDVVRQKHGYRGVYFIRPNGGFTNLSQTGEEWDHKFEFTSEFYERVTLE